MSSSDSKTAAQVPSSPTMAAGGDTFRTKSVATRLTEAEFAEVESAAANSGKKVGEWLRDAALAQARSRNQSLTDPVLLAEIMGMRDLMLNLFAVASKGPISDEILRRISAYSDRIKQQKADEYLERLRAQFRS